MSWYWCLEHSTVEPKDGCKEADRLGPYATREEAEQGLSSLKAREERISAEDAAWEAGGEPDPPA